jgi:threonyl-tRNA synthetase
MVVESSLRVWLVGSFAMQGAYSYQPGALGLTPRTLSVSSTSLVLPKARAAASNMRMAAVQAPTGNPSTEEVAAEPVHMPTNEESEQLLKIRHTSAHVMAMAVQKLFKDAKVTIGPWIEKGFYYDFDRPEPFLEKDLRRIKKEMDKIIQQKLPLVREEVSAEEAERRIREQEEPFKLEILESIVKRDPDAPITIYHIGGSTETPGEGARWWDLCAGPHVEHTGMLPKDAIALESIAGAYWRGDEKRPMLQRIYGTAWERKEQLDEHSRLLAEAKRRDHRTIGKAMNLFSIQPDAGGGLVFWHPKGARVRKLMEDVWHELHVEGGYEMLYTPHMASLDLWKTSGHFDFYADGMFDQMEVSDHAIRVATPQRTRTRIRMCMHASCTALTPRLCFSCHFPACVYRWRARSTN